MNGREHTKQCCMCRHVRAAYKHGQDGTQRVHGLVSRRHSYSTHVHTNRHVHTPTHVPYRWAPCCPKTPTQPRNIYMRVVYTHPHTHTNRETARTHTRAPLVCVCVCVCTHAHTTCPGTITSAKQQISTEIFREY